MYRISSEYLVITSHYLFYVRLRARTEVARVLRQMGAMVAPLLVLVVILMSFCVANGFTSAWKGPQSALMTTASRHDPLVAARTYETALGMARGGRGGGRGGRGGKSGPKQKKVKDDVIVVNGKVVEALPNAMFRVEIEPSKAIALVTVSGKIRKNYVRIVIGDSVVVELSAYDLSRGRITYRNKA